MIPDNLEWKPLRKITDWEVIRRRKVMRKGDALYAEVHYSPSTGEYEIVDIVYGDANQYDSTSNFQEAIETYNRCIDNLKTMNY